MPNQKINNMSRYELLNELRGHLHSGAFLLSDDEAVAIVFPLSMDQRLLKMKEIAAINPLNADAAHALAELQIVMKGIQYVRNNVVHAIIVTDQAGNHTFHLRSKRRSLTMEQIFSVEELTNYAGHAVLSLRYALGHKQLAPYERHPLPDRPEIPEFLRVNS